MREQAREKEEQMHSIRPNAVSKSAEVSDVTIESLDPLFDLWVVAYWYCTCTPPRRGEDQKILKCLPEQQVHSKADIAPRRSLDRMVFTKSKR